MPTWTYRCAKGHLTDRTFVSHTQRTRTTKCRRCPRRARINYAATLRGGTIQVCPDIPEHFNVTTNCVVRSRRHLTDLQKRHGWQDYEKDSSKKKSDWRDRPNQASAAAALAAAEGARRYRDRND